MNPVLALDIGSSSIKGAWLDREANRVVPCVQEPFPSRVAGLPPTWYEVDAGQIVARCQQVLEELAEACPEATSILVASQMGGVVLTDRATRPLTNYLSWRDQRLLEPTPQYPFGMFGTLAERIGEGNLQRIGRELRPGSATSLLAWLAAHGALPEGVALAMHLGDLVVAQCARAVPCTEPTLALGTIDLPTGTLASAVFDQFECGHVDWPALRNVAEPCGEFVHRGRRLAIHPAVGDHQAALYGCELTFDELSINCSTGSQVSRLTPSLELGDYQTRMALGEGFLNTLTHLPAGRSLNALIDLLTELPRRAGVDLPDVWSWIDEAVREVPATDLEANLSFFEGPCGRVGSLQNMRLENLSVGHVFRAAFRTMADNYWHCARRVFAQTPWTSVVVSGGLPQKCAPLRALLAERFVDNLRWVSSEEETFVGLLRLARQMAA